MTSRQYASLALDAQVVATHGAAARARMHDYLAGWPTGASSAGVTRPATCECDGPRRIDLTTRPHSCLRCHLPFDTSSGIPHDPHRVALEEWDQRAKRATADLRWLASHAMVYGASAMPDKDSVKRYLTDVEQMLYCPKCLVHGIKEPKEQGRSICREHRDWQERHPGVDKPFKLLDAKARGFTKAYIAKLYSEWLRENPHVQPKGKRGKASKLAERGTDVETVAGMTERFGGAA